MRTQRSATVALASGLITAVALLVLVIPFIALGDQSLQATVVIFLINVTLVLSLQSFVGNSGILSFGHVAFMGVGAYVTAWLTIPVEQKAQQLPDLPGWLATAEWGLLPTVVAGGFVAAALAAFVGIVLVRMTVNAMVMATLALLLVMTTLWINWTALTRGASGVIGIPREMTPLIAIGAAVVFTVITRFFKGTRVGLQLRASREDELAASSSGINVRGVRYTSWILSAFLMGAAGSLWAFNIIAFDPGQFSFAITFALLAMLILGGRESVLGAIVGAGLISLVTDVFSRVEQGISLGSFELPRITGTVQFVIALIIILVLIFRPDGVVGRREIEDFVPALARWLRIPRGGAADRGSVDASAGSPGDRVALKGVNLRKSFKGLKAVDGIDIEVKAGEILGLIGPNGSGKSTLLNLLSGVTRPDSGDTFVDSVRMTGRPSFRVARAGLARTFQNLRLFSHLTVIDNVMAPARSDYARGIRAMEQLGIMDLRYMEADSLAYGLRRRLEIARAMGTAPTVVLLDEPAAGLNHVESDVLLVDIRTLAEEYHCGVIIIDHDLRLIMRLCDRIQVLVAGRTIAVGTPAEVSVDPVVTAAYLGDNAADSREVNK